MCHVEPTDEIVLVTHSTRVTVARGKKKPRGLEATTCEHYARGKDFTRCVRNRSDLKSNHAGAFRIGQDIRACCSVDYNHVSRTRQNRPPLPPNVSWKTEPLNSVD